MRVEGARWIWRKPDSQSGIAQTRSEPCGPPRIGRRERRPLSWALSRPAERTCMLARKRGQKAKWLSAGNRQARPNARPASPPERDRVQPEREILREYRAH